MCWHLFIIISLPALNKRQIEAAFFPPLVRIGPPRRVFYDYDVSISLHAFRARRVRNSREISGGGARTGFSQSALQANGSMPG